MPPLVVNIQFVKDLSFEVPGAPTIFSSLRSQPQVAINLDVQARRVDETQPVYEVALVIRAEANETQPGGEPRPVFIAELTYAGLLEGAVLTETVFSWPGIGQYLTGSLLNADMNAVLGATLVIGLTYVGLNLLADLAYRVLDPRVR